MKSYPSIRHAADFSLRYHIFDKLDGSNVRAEWTPARGFYKFGSRTQLLTPDQATLWPSVAVIERLSESLGAQLKKLKTERAVCFFEWAGPQSFAGSHHDDPSPWIHSFWISPFTRKAFCGQNKCLRLRGKWRINTEASPSRKN
jgi:hypothetical protein